MRDDAVMLRVLEWFGAVSRETGVSIEKIRPHTARFRPRTASGALHQPFGEQRIRAALRSLREDGVVGRRRSWGSAYRYWVNKTSAK